MSVTLPKHLKDGVQFECQGSGNCCVSHGEFGYVFLTHKDQTRMAKALNLKRAQFLKEYCYLENGFWAIKPNPAGPECLFLKERRCSIYSGRPTQCRTWPFWPSVMSARSWSKSVEAFCPGVGKGRNITPEEIIEAAQKQEASENELQTENVPTQKRSKV